MTSVLLLSQLRSARIFSGHRQENLVERGSIRDSQTVLKMLWETCKGIFRIIGVDFIEGIYKNKVSSKDPYMIVGRIEESKCYSK